MLLRTTGAMSLDTFFITLTLKDERPKWMHEQGIEDIWVHHIHNTTLCTVIRHDAPIIKSLPWLSGRERGYPYVSEKVPAEFRGFMLLQEIIKQEITNSLGYHLEALKSLLSMIPEDLAKSFMPFQCQYVKSLIEHYSGGDGTNTKLVDELKACLEHINLIGKEDRLQALKNELSLLPPELAQKYTALRRQDIAVLVAQLADQSNTDPKLLQELRACLAYIDNLNCSSKRPVEGGG